MITSILFTLIILASAALLVTAAFSPLETLSWWAGWTEDELDIVGPAPLPSPEDNQRGPYVVYLSGIASISGQYLIPREKAFIKALKKRLPDATIIADVFPYSPSGVHLIASPRSFEKMWRWLQKLKLQGRRSLLSTLINLRNVYQVMISADHRYGPIYNQGAAQAIETALLGAGYAPNSGAPITIIGYSGGAQIAVGAVTFLKARLSAPIDVISIGGVIASDPGLNTLRRLHHIFGDGDNVRRFGALMFPERWSILANSEWNAAKRDGRISFYKMADMLHAGPQGYFGLPKKDGVSNNQRTLERVVGILSEPGPSTKQIQPHAF